MTSKERVTKTTQDSLSFREYLGVILPRRVVSVEEEGKLASDQPKTLSFREYLGVILPPRKRT